MSSSMVYERATVFPTAEADLPDCPTPNSAYGFSKLAGEIETRAANEEFGLRSRSAGRAMRTAQASFRTLSRDHARDPRPVRQGLLRAASASDPRRGEPDPGVYVHRRCRRRDHRCDVLPGRVERGLQPHQPGGGDGRGLTRGAFGRRPARRPTSSSSSRSSSPTGSTSERRILSGEKAARVLGWQPQVSLDAGLRRTAEWMTAQDEGRVAARSWLRPGFDASHTLAANGRTRPGPGLRGASCSEIARSCATSKGPSCSCPGPTCFPITPGHDRLTDRT